MTADQNKIIKTISYNHLNLPKRIVLDTGRSDNIQYFYDATGIKLKKIVTDVRNNTVTTTEYLNGFQYKNEQLQFFPTAEGYVNSTLVNGSNTYNYVYNYTDHLGNIRLSYTKNPATGTLKIIEENHNYPFGLKHNYNTTDYQYAASGSGVVLSQVTENGYNYQYNGKEWQDELGYNMYDMDMRQYDPAIARWIVQDPVVHHSMSPYNAFDNNPVFWADPSGADSMPNWLQEIWNISGSGETKWTNNNDGTWSGSNGETVGEKNNNESNKNQPPDIIFSDNKGNEIYRIKEPWWIDFWDLDNLNITLNEKDLSNGGFFAYVLEIGGTGHSFLLDLTTGYYWEASHPRDAEGNVIPVKDNLFDGDGVKSIIMKRNINDSDFWTNNAGGKERGKLKVFPIFVPNKNSILNFANSNVGVYDYNAVTNNCKHFTINALKSGGASLSFLSFGPMPADFSSKVAQWRGNAGGVYISNGESFSNLMKK